MLAENKTVGIFMFIFFKNLLQINILINGNKTNVEMKLKANGEGYFPHQKNDDLQYEKMIDEIIPNFEDIWFSFSGDFLN